MAAALAALTIGAAHAGDPPRPIEPEKLTGDSAFEWATSTGKCKKVDAALIKKWQKGYTCMPPEEGVGTASGKPLAATCKAKKGRSELLVFKEMDDCKAERDAQLAHAE